MRKTYTLLSFKIKFSLDNPLKTRQTDLSEVFSFFGPLLEERFLQDRAYVKSCSFDVIDEQGTKETLHKSIEKERVYKKSTVLDLIDVTLTNGGFQKENVVKNGFKYVSKSSPVFSVGVSVGKNSIEVYKEDGRYYKWNADGFYYCGMTQSDEDESLGMEKWLEAILNLANDKVCEM